MLSCQVSNSAIELLDDHLNENLSASRPPIAPDKKYNQRINRAKPIDDLRLVERPPHQQCAHHKRRDHATRGVNQKLRNEQNQ